MNFGDMTMTTTNTKSEAKNTRTTSVSIFTKSGQLIDCITTPALYGSAEKYCKAHPTGKHGLRYLAAVAKAKSIDATKSADNWHWFIPRMAA